MAIDKAFWKSRYTSNQTGWDIGFISTPLKSYIDQIRDKNIPILIPGCGNAHEAEYLMQQGFTNVTVIDIAEEAVNSIMGKSKEFIKQGKLKVVCGDFFELQSSFDLIIEQTFFCALDPDLRKKYAQKMNELLNPNGKLVGVLFGVEMQGGPPFGGTKDEYLNYFSALFEMIVFETCYNSIPQREARELFMILKKKN